MADMKKILLLLPFVLAVGGCNGRGESAAPNLDMMALASTPASRASFDMRPRSIAVDSALAHLPEGAGAPRLARDRRYPNGYWQEVILASDVATAESQIAVAIQTGGPLASSDKVPVWKPGEAGIRDELARTFPNMAMQVVANGAYANQYGRFGLAMGRRGESLRCVYAWQYIADARQSFAGGAHIPQDGASPAPAALRIKLCRADATIDELVGYVRELSVVIPDNFGAAEEIATSERHRYAAAPAPKKRKPANRELARARLAPDYGAAQPAYVAAAPAPYAPAAYGGAPSAPAAEGPRYLAPVNAPVVAAPSRTAGSGLNPDLPPQAYRGPGAAGSAGATAASNSYQRSSSLPADRTPTVVIGDNSGAPRVTSLNSLADRPN
jgi:hypothetical protein